MTVIMLSKEDQAFEILQDILRITDAEQQETIKQLTEQLVSAYSEFANIVPENEEEGSPYKKKMSLRSDGSFKFNQEFLLEKMDKTEKELNQLKGNYKLKEERIINLEQENQLLKDQLSKMKSQFDHLNLENEDFKKRANIGMIDVLELELKQKKQQVKEITARLEDKQKEYSTKLHTYQDQFDEYRKRISDLEEYRTKYENLMARQDKEGGVSDEDLREEYEK